MALFNKKKSQPAAAPDAAASSTSDDFSDFSPEALAGGVDDAADDGSGKKRKGKRGAAKTEAKSSSGRAIKPGTAIGLNIGNDSIKVLEASAKGNEITITAMGMVPTPPESISNGVVMSANALVIAIRDAMTQAGIKSKKVVTSISGTGALVVRIIEVPKMSDGELLDNMKMDADRYIPFPPSEVEMDFKALRELPSDPDSPNMEVLLAAAQREIIDLHVQVLQDAKLDPRAIDVEPLAVARALTHPLTAKPLNGAHANGASNSAAAIAQDVDYNDVSAILNIGASGMEISILRGDLLVFTRTVPTGGNSLTQAMVDSLGLAWSDAEQLKREMGDALPPTTESSAPSSGTSTTAAGDLSWNANDDNDDWSAFNEEEADSGAGISTAAPVAEAPPADPFEDDFFEQGPAAADPVNAEPGEQHQQKEPENAGASGGGASSGESASDTPVSPPSAKPFFDFGDEEPQDDIPTLKEDAPASYADLLGKEEDDFSELPTLTPDAPPATSLPSAFDFPGESAPPAARSAAPVSSAEPDASDAELPTFQGAPASTEAVGDGTRVDPEDATVLPSEAEPAPFAFSFGEPAVPTPAPAAPASASPAPSSASPAPSSASPAPSSASPADSGAAFDFGLDSPQEATSPPSTPPATASASASVEADPFAEFMASAGESPAAPSGSAAAPAASAPAPAEAADDFDLDSLFGAGAAPAAGGTAAAGAAAVDSALDLDDFGLGGDAATDDFSADLADFGVGLAGTSVGEIDAKALYEVLEPSLDNLVNEVRRSLEYHTTRYPDAAVRNVTIVGGGAKLKNLDAYLTQKLGLPVTLGNPALRLGQNAPKLPPGYTDEHGTVFTVALGLAMRELTK